MSGLREPFSRFVLGVNMSTVGRTKQLLPSAPDLWERRPPRTCALSLKGGGTVGLCSFLVFWCGAARCVDRTEPNALNL